MPDPQRIAAARALFPRGLIQPEHSFHFSRDALILTDFAARIQAGSAVVDLGTGCGILGLGLAIRRPELCVVGVEKDEELSLAAQKNAAGLGLEQVRILTGDLASTFTLHQARQQLACLSPGTSRDGQAPLFDLALCNPPWRREGAGRIPPSPARRTAMFGDAGTFPLFFNAADRLLRVHGSLALVCGAERTADVLAALPDRLKPVRLRFVHPHPDSPAVFLLLEARKGSRGTLQVEEPLFLTY